MTQNSDRDGSLSDAAVHAGLLRRVGRQRDREAFRSLFDHFAPRIRAFLLRRRVPPALADDLTQEALLTVWRRAESYDVKKAAASTWIYTIARNLHIDHYRKDARAKKLDEHDPQFQPPEAPTPDELCARAEDVDIVSEALGALPQDQRAVLELAFVEGLSHREVADRLDLPLGTVKSRIRLAMDKLRTSLGDVE